MIKIKFLIIAFASLMLTTSCSDNEDNSPSNADKDRLETLIDRSIPKVNEFCDKYGTYLLYDFDQQLDFAYQFIESTEWNNAKLTKLNKAEALSAVDYLYNEVFNCYSDDFKKKFLPRKFIIVKSIEMNATESVTTVDGTIVATATANSVTVAFDPAAEHSQEYKHAIHSAILSDYLISVRERFPAGESFLSYSLSYYSSLMDANRTQAYKLPDEFFLERGFFRPEEDESTYFVSAIQDMETFAEKLVCMTEDMQSELIEYPLIAEKLHLMAEGLNNMGIDIVSINPFTEDFLKIENAGIRPTISVAPIETNIDRADADITFWRGAHDFSKAEIYLNGELYETIDLSKNATSSKFTRTVTLTGLHKGNNYVEVRVYEVGRKRPSQTISTLANYMSMDNIMAFRISNSNSNSYRFFMYNGYDYIEDKNVSNMTTVRFVKSPTDVDMQSGVETGGITRFWKVYKTSGRVTRIEVIDQTVDYEAFKYINKLITTYEFKYNEYGELESATRNGKVFADNVVYANGNIVSYSYEGKTYTPQYATVNGQEIRVDCLDAAMSGHHYVADGTEDANPYYITGLPAIIPGTEAEIPLDLIYTPYLFNSVEGLWDKGWVLYENTNTAVVDIDGVEWTYRFILK